MHSGELKEPSKAASGCINITSPSPFFLGNSLENQLFPPQNQQEICDESFQPQGMLIPRNSHLRSSLCVRVITQALGILQLIQAHILRHLEFQEALSESGNVGMIPIYRVPGTAHPN